MQSFILFSIAVVLQASYCTKYHIFQDWLQNFPIYINHINQIGQND